MRKNIALAMTAAIMLSAAGCAQNTGASVTAAPESTAFTAAETAAAESSVGEQDTEKAEVTAEGQNPETVDTAAEGQNTEAAAAASGEQNAKTASAFAETESSTAEETYTAEYSCSEDNAHALSADGEEAAYDHILVTKTGDGEGDEADFYGLNAAVYAENGAALTITDSRIETAGSHANAVFSYGEGSVINISDSVIETSENTSGGIMVTGGGTLNAKNLTVTTQGGSSAAIRSDRGGGKLIVDGGSYASYGSGSPAIYSTADVTVNNAELYSDISQTVVVEGKNSVTLNDTNAVGKNTKKNSDKSDYYQAVMIYQSMSGDAAEGKGSFTMNGGSLHSLNGGMFFVTNTVADIALDHVELGYATDDLLRICAAGWGNDGSNGGQVTFKANDQSLEGVITVDEVSTLNLILGGSSSFEGSFDNAGEVYVELGDEAVWKLTADSSITSLTCSESAIDLNGFSLTVNGTEYKEGTASEGTAIEVKVSETNHQGDRPGKPGEGGKPDGSNGHGNSRNGGKDVSGSRKPGGHNRPGTGETPPEKPEGGFPGNGMLPEKTGESTAPVVSS